MKLTTADEILRSRATLFANRKKEEIASENKISVTVFVAGSEQFGVPTTSLACIVKTPAIAAMPYLPSWFRGMAQVRGEIVGVVDPAGWFGVPVKSSCTFMAVVEGTPGKLGLLVDKVLGFRDVGQSDLAASVGEGGAVWERPIRGATRDLTAILDMEKLFKSPDLRVCFGLDGERNDESIDVPE